MERLVRPPLQAILGAIDGIQAAMAGRTLQDYSSSWLLKHAVERGIEIISEAARRLPATLQDEHPEIPWKQIMAVGNVLRHNYDRIADRIIFEVVQHDLAPLKATIAAIEASLEEPSE